MDARRHPQGTGYVTAWLLLWSVVFPASIAPGEARPASGSLTDPTLEPARYEVRMRSEVPPRLNVTAILPIDGSALGMDTTRPSVIDEPGSRGWPGLIRNLRAKDGAGRPVRLTPAGEAGWRLPRALSGRLTVEYEVDYSLLAERGWPAPREAAYSEAEHFATIGRALFVTTPQVKQSFVRFDLPRGWRPVTPWQPSASSRGEFAVRSAAELVENFVVLSRSEPEVVTAAGFRLLMTPMGHWRQVRPELRKVLGSVIQRFVRILEFDRQEGYLVVLLPVLDQGGESFRNSFALTMDVPPTPENLSTWANTIAHEIFHYWNGWRLRGADYSTSQWFQEGFTEYFANLALVASGGIDGDGFLRKLTGHVRNYRKLATPLEAGGSRKGPPLYSGGALVAFCWDVLIRQASDGRQDLGDFLRALWERNGRDERPYEWSDIRSALDRTARRNWDAFHLAHIQGSEPLPLGEVLPLAGLRLGRAGDGSELVELDPAASPQAKALWKGLIAER